MRTSVDISFDMVDITAKRDSTVTAANIQSFTNPDSLALYRVLEPAKDAVKATAIIDKAITADMLEDANEVVVTVK